MPLYDQQAELDGVYCDICGHHHSPDCSQTNEDRGDEVDLRAPLLSEGVDLTEADITWVMSMLQTKIPDDARTAALSETGQPSTELNTALALDAATTLRAYGALRHGEGEQDVFTLMRDLINDLRHLADATGIDWARASSLIHYQEQIDPA